jgi:hypothetical protein
MRPRQKRRFFTAAESAEIWDRWCRGEGLKSIGRVFGKTSSSIFAHIRPSGGIRPPRRRRSRLALTLAEREEISRGLVHGHSLRRIACGLGRSPSTVGREIARNGGCGPYRAAASDISRRQNDFRLVLRRPVEVTGKSGHSRGRTCVIGPSPIETRVSLCFVKRCRGIAHTSEWCFGLRSHQQSPDPCCCCG